MTLKITKYQVHTQKKGISLKIALVADLHAMPCGKVIDAVKKISPDVILCAGDIMERVCEENAEKNKNGLEFFLEATRIAPVYYCTGNHETEGGVLPSETVETIESYGVTCVFDSFAEISDGVAVGGLISAGRAVPNLEFIREFDSYDGYRILLSHHPEYYPKYLCDSSIDLILSGHAHGGQWRIFGCGVYAPGQGLFPKYTSGVHDGRLVISRGCANHTRPIRVPRIFNPTEVVEICVSSK